VGLQADFGVSERRACAVVGQARSTQRRLPAPLSDEEARLRTWLRGFSARHPRWGVRKAASCARKASFLVNRKRVQRLWRDEGLRVPCRARKREDSGDSVHAVRGFRTPAWREPEMAGGVAL
jgi:putative transposase